jgi:hypothetical protein
MDLPAFERYFDCYLSIYFCARSMCCVRDIPVCIINGSVIQGALCNEWTMMNASTLIISPHLNNGIKINCLCGCKKAAFFYQPVSSIISSLSHSYVAFFLQNAMELKHRIARVAFCNKNSNRVFETDKEYIYSWKKSSISSQTCAMGPRRNISPRRHWLSPLTLFFPKCCASNIRDCLQLLDGVQERHKHC